MGRTRRPYLPGCIFHLTARTLRKEHWFNPDLRSAVVDALVDVVGPSRMRLVAVAVMSNHLHVVAQQGDRPLAALMQPLLRRVAYRVQRAHRVEGPVFWRHYASRACLDPSHARNAVAYVHLNPVRAGVCADPGDYLWTSHTLYADGCHGDDPGHLQRLATVLDPTLALPLFAMERGRSTPELRHDYREFVAWRRSLDDPETGVGAHAPELVAGPRPGAQRHNSSWDRGLSPFFHEPMWLQPPRQPHGIPSGVPDMATIAKRVLEAESPSLSLTAVRKSKGGPERVRVRHTIIRRLSAAGYPNVKIARFLGLSDSAVSYVLRKAQ